MKKFFTYLVSCSIIILFIGCQNEEDLFDPSKQTVPEELQALTVPTDFDWSTSTSAIVTVNVGDQYNGKNYMVEIFSNNPIISDSALLMVKDLVPSNGSFTTTVTYPKGLGILYIRQTDPTGTQIVKEYSTQSGSVVANFKTEDSALKSAPAKRSTPVTASYTTPANAVVISNSLGSSYEMNPSKGKAYVIKDTYTGSLTYSGWGQGVELYIEGTWNNTATSLRMDTGDKLIVQNTGKIIFQNDIAISMTNSALFYIAKNVTMNVTNSKNVVINSTNNTQQLVNYGIIKLGTISNLPLLHNEGTITLDKLTCDNNTSVVDNYKTLNIVNADLTNGYINNYCKIAISGQLTSNGTTFNLASGSLFTATTINVQGAKFNLSAQSMLNVTQQATFNSNTSKIVGVDSGYGLVKLKKEVSTGWISVIYSGHIEIECSNHTQNQMYFTYYTLESSSGARMVAEGSSTVKITSTDCNNGGNGGGTGGGPTDPVYPQTVTLGTAYTYAFEDNYPSIGDYDMNDFVSDVSVSYKLSAQNKVSQITLTATLRAVGATKHLAAAIQLDGVAASNVSSVTRTGPNLSGGVFNLSNGIETGQTNAVIPIADNAHAALGVASTNTFVNTKTDGVQSVQVPTKVVALTITLNTPVDISQKSVLDMINFFIINGGYSVQNRLEVHLRGFAATQKATDVSSGHNYNTTGNLVYGIRIPASFKYPKEYQSILKAYTNFQAWVTSGGTTQTNWYNLPTTSLIYQ